jgi:hypothetical protein
MDELDDSILAVEDAIIELRFRLQSEPSKAGSIDELQLLEARLRQLLTLQPTFHTPA